MNAVERYVAALPPALRAEVQALRAAILGAAGGIGEAIKWNAPSFHTGEHFATLRLGGKIPLQLILHLGAKKAVMPEGAIDDPTGLLRWLGPDRACVDFAAPGAVAVHAPALQAIVRQWMRHVPAGL